MYYDVQSTMTSPTRKFLVPCNRTEVSRIVLQQCVTVSKVIVHKYKEMCTVYIENPSDYDLVRVQYQYRLPPLTGFNLTGH